MILPALLLALIQTPTGADEAAIRARLAEWRDAANRGDQRASLETLAPDLLTEFPGRPDRTYADAARSAPPSGPPTWRHEFDIKEVLVEGDLGVVRVDFRSERRQPDGSWKLGEAIETMQVWRRQPDGKWRMARTLSGKLPDAP
jgi:ketosteroid isomerase-like protein